MNRPTTTSQSRDWIADPVLGSREEWTPTPTEPMEGPKPRRPGRLRRAGFGILLVLPIAGRLGIRRISVGQFLDKGSPVVSLQSLDPVYVDFSLPQQRLGDLADGLKVMVSSDSYPGEEFEGSIHGRESGR